jgi:hypothetical protein
MPFELDTSTLIVICAAISVVLFAEPSICSASPPRPIAATSTAASNCREASRTARRS